MNKKFLWILVGIIVIGLVAINISRPKVEPSNKFYAKVPSQTTSHNANIKALELFVDFSGSMKGFIDFSGLSEGNKANSTFKSTVLNFLNNVEAKYSIRSGNHCGDKVYSKKEFQKKMEDKTIFNQGVTLLHEMIEQDCAQANDTTIIAIVSDMVLSYGKSRLNAEKDTFYNKNHLEDLEGYIHGAMTSLKSKQLDVVLLQYLSDFNGRHYYNFTENIKDGVAYIGKLMKNRPFYILLVGKKESLKNILEKECLKEAANIFASFGMETPDMKEAAYSVKQDPSTEFWTEGIAEEGMGGFWTTSNFGSEVTKFSITCNDFKIPSYLGHRNENLSAQCTNGNVSGISYDEQHSTIQFSVETEQFNKLGKETVVDAHIISNNKWEDEASVKDDNDVGQDPKTLEGKTWGLKHIIAAINEAYHGRKISEGELIGSFSFVLRKM